MSKFVTFEGGLNYTTRTDYELSRTVTTNDLMEWCDARLQGHYTNTLMMGSGSTLWMFENRKDAIWFALTWT